MMEVILPPPEPVGYVVAQIVSALNSTKLHLQYGKRMFDSESGCLKPFSFALAAWALDHGTWQVSKPAVAS